MGEKTNLTIRKNHCTNYSLFIIHYSLFIIILILLTNTPVKAQVIIKEKVEIDPQNINPEYPASTNTPCGPWISSYDYYNPWQVVWNNTSFAPDPYQQMFNFQDNRYGPGLQRRTYKFDPDKIYNITIQQSEEYAYFSYGGYYDNTTGSYVPIQYAGTMLSGVQGSDLGAANIYDYVQDYPNGLYRNDSKYKMRIKRDVPSGTEITMVVFDGQETINYHTRIETPTFVIENITNEDTLLHYYSREIEFRLNFQQSCQLDGYGGAYPEGIKFNVEIIQGQEYGNLYYPGTVAEPEQSGISITNLDDEYGIGIATYSIKYKADGIQPEENTPGIVVIRCSANDMDIAPVEVSFPVKYNTDPPEEGGNIVVVMDKQSYEPGDTAIANCKWLTGYNELVDFPSEQEFNVEIAGGNEFGVLLDSNTGEVGEILQGVGNGFGVITSGSIPYDSVVIRIRVTTTVGGEIATRVVRNKKEVTEAKGMKTAEDKGEGITPEVFIGGEELVGYGDVVVKKREGWCDDLDECDEIEFPNVELDVHENNWQGLDACGSDFLAGTNFFTSNSSFYIEDFDIELCKEVGSDKVQLIFNDDIVINCVSDMCEANISAGQDILIDDVYSFPGTMSCKDKIFWIELHKEYPYPTRIISSNGIIESVYIIRYVWMRHEEEHRKHFLNVAEGFKEEYLNKVKDIKEQCSKFSSEEEAKLYFKKAAEKVIKQFYDAVKNEDDRISSGDDYGGDVIKFEKDKIHKKVIDDYLQPLIDRWKLTNCID